jgi:hypothetical protein
MPHRARQRQGAMTRLILVPFSTPDTSNVCHQWLFDNHNGQFSDNGYVDCQRAFYQGSTDSPKQWSAVRVRVISTGFRGE